MNVAVAAAADLEGFLDRVQESAFLATNVTGIHAAVLGTDRREGRQLVDLAVGAGHIDEARRHAPGALAHTAVDELAHLVEFFGRGVFHMPAEDGGAHFAVGDQVRDVRPGAVFVDGREILGDIPFAAAAVAGDQRGAALLDVIGGGAILGREDRVVAVAVVVQVDEPGRHNQTGAVDGLLNLSGLELANGNDPIAANRQIAPNRPRTGPVQYLPAAQQDVGVDRGGIDFGCDANE